MLILFAHGEEGSGWGGPVEPWEFHPMLVHFPIAFLLGGVILDLYAWWRGSPGLVRIATGLLVAGVAAGVLTALAGWLAMETVPAHTEQAHGLMQWHMYLQLATLGMFAVAVYLRWRDRASSPGSTSRILGWVAVIGLTVGSAFGGYIVYHGGAGVEPKLLSHELREGKGH